MNVQERIRQRRSVRTFNGVKISNEVLADLLSYCESIQNPYRIPVNFIVLDAEECGLSSKVIKGESHYIAGIIGNVPHALEAYGYSFEKMVLYAESLGLGTTIIAGTFDRKAFEKEFGIQENERMFCVSPLGYPSEKMSINERAMRLGVGADKRKPFEDLFFENGFKTPYKTQNSLVRNSLEAVRLAPSAVNKQPWRVICDEKGFHFYEKDPAANGPFDIRKIDLGIALCHFMSVYGGTLKISDPGYRTPDKTEYIATVVSV